ncbi:hypothetical protein DEO72_LG5g1838 [Vigna unguiculata]|uniref:Uncharacterized protein n=1 Tax=Vigna unguiculata TaxID=3917 RepID=A0A4D6LXY8_VIGUN|nr:hypothetical protein DEO72_LG5g1838 [Vigna unguiculata]
MPALVVDTSAHPRVAHPRAMCYKCYNESISLTTRQKGLAQARRTLAQARRTLAQASSLRLGESSTSSMRTLRAFSLRRDPPRLSETFTRLKHTSGRLGDPSRRNT